MASLNDFRSGFYRDYPNAGKTPAAPAGETPEERAKKIRLQQIMSGGGAYRSLVPTVGGRPIVTDQGASPEYVRPTGALAPGAGTNAAELGMSPRTPEQQAAMSRTEQLLSWSKGASGKYAPNDAMSVAMGGQAPAPGVSVGIAPPVAAPMSAAQPTDRRSQASAKWRETLAITDPAAKKTAQDKLLTDFMDVADPKYLESRGMMGPAKPQAPGAQGLRSPAEMTFASERMLPGTRAWNDATRGDRQMESDLRRAARSARREGDYLAAANISKGALNEGYEPSSFGSFSSRTARFTELDAARRASSALNASQYGGGLIKQPRNFGDIQQPGTQQPYRRF